MRDIYRLASKLASNIFGALLICFIISAPFFVIGAILNSEVITCIGLLVLLSSIFMMSDEGKPFRKPVYGAAVWIAENPKQFFKGSIKIGAHIIKWVAYIFVGLIGLAIFLWAIVNVSTNPTIIVIILLVIIAVQLNKIANK